MKLYKIHLTAYRVFAFVAMYAILVIAAGYGFTMGFYSLNKAWIVPITISPSSDKILQMNQAITTSVATLNTLNTNNANLMKQRVELMQERQALLALSAQLSQALKRAQTNNGVSDSALADLIKQKQDDIAHTKQMLDQYNQMEANIEHDLKMGFITQQEAVQQQTTLAQFKNSFTDSKVSQVMTELTRQKLTNGSIDSVDVIQKQVALHAQIAQIDLQTSQGDEQLKNNNNQIAVIEKALNTSKTSPYYLAAAAATALDFAFVPYDNSGGVQPNSKVYDCYLSMVVCREVGTVKAVFTDEEKATNPFYKTDIRGTMVQLNLVSRESVKSKTLFVNGKPLFF